MRTRRHIVRHTKRHKKGPLHAQRVGGIIIRHQICVWVAPRCACSDFWLLDRQNWLLGFIAKHLYKRAKNSWKRFSILNRQNWLLGFTAKHLYERGRKNPVQKALKRPVRTLTFHQPPSLSVEWRSSGMGAVNRSFSAHAAIALRKLSNFSSSGICVLSMSENTDQMYAL